MPVKIHNDKKVWMRRDRREVLTHWACWMAALLVILICWHQISEATIWAFITDSHAQAWDLLARMTPPQWSYMEHLWKPLWDTINIATLGTLIAVLLAVPLAFLAANNTTPHKMVRQAALVLIVSSRSINTLIWAILFVILFGPGVVAGVMAISLRSIGFIGKLLYESIEEISVDPVEAMRAVGGDPGQVLIYGIVPQVFPSFVGISVFRWDINIRESTIVGLVGAGGIGLQLDAAVSGLEWSRVSLMLVLVFLMVLISEWVSASIRKRLI